MANIQRASEVPGYMPIRELTWLAEWAAKSRIVVEIGSWKGRSTRALGDNVKQRVYAVDHWLGQLRDPAAAPTRELLVRGGGDRAAGHDFIWNEFRANLADLIDKGKVIPIDHNSQNGLPAELLPLRGRVDLLFIDGDHSYEGCKSDIDHYGPLVRPGGIISGHDYNSQPRHAGVRRIVDEYYGKSAKFCQTIWWVNR